MRKKFIALSIVTLGLVALSFTPPAERYFEIAKNLDIFASLFKEVNALYVDEVNPNKLIRTGIDAMLESLDPYTNFIAEDEVETYRTLNTGQYGGIGAVTRVIGNRTVVTMVYEGYPAEKNGLKIGDEVIKMDGIELSKLTIEEANQLMRGQLGTSVKLEVKRAGVNNPIELEFKREKVKISNVPYSGMVSKNIGYVQLADFTPDAGKEVKNAVVNLKSQGATGIILDLRDNPGGLLFEAVNICNIFLPKGKKIVTTKGKTEDSNVAYETLNNPVDLEIPVAVLINRGSASASEIVAGTLQDYDRAVVIGEKSFGKGLVQLSRPLSYNSQVKITTAKYYTPTGRCIQVLDYSHRRDDGSVGSIPDSLKKAFKTTNGRTVYDGGGIDPDMVIDGDEIATLTQVLYGNGFIFDYATIYASEHPTIAPARDFKLTDKEYDGFVMWVKSRQYNYRSPVEIELSLLKEQAKRERYYEDLRPQIDQITELLKESRKKDLYTFKDQIKMLLEQDIVSRYYLEKGSTEVEFQYDADIKKSIEVLNNSTLYKKTLKII
ncbi:MAG TPA: S41 family peptidase [Cyclobacteriaceae bacterium]|nr:S41 family peptidase [Cyclobacteriaceae bacterium]